MNLTRRSLIKGMAAAVFAVSTRFYPAPAAPAVHSEEPVVLLMTGATKGLRVCVLDSDDGTVLYNEEVQEDGPLKVKLDRPRTVDIRCMGLPDATYTSFERVQPVYAPVQYQRTIDRNYS